jgi:hypothetical protein
MHCDPDALTRAHSSSALMTPPDPPKRPIGFVHADDKDSKARARGKA